MNAIKFIKNNGVDKAREVLSGAPDGATHLSDDTSHYVNADFKPLPAHIKEQLPKLIVIDDIERMVESVDLVKRYGGIAEVKTLHQDEFWNERVFERLKQAIADYELIYEVK